MTTYLRSSGPLDPVGTAARAPVISAFLVFVGLCLLWVFTLVSRGDRPERLHVADRSLLPLLNGADTRSATSSPSVRPDRGRAGPPW
ncbi:hypothetical protein [Streptomyces sp. NPDC008122]|uniref:hypothetical protein n=1 Tax=Streptomyces sp. NPDC008122 TaxID=3364810 RepID=UPI0036E1F201